MGSSATWLPQDPVPSRAARRRSPAQRLRDELRPLLGESWSEELERDVPHAWQRHGDLVLLSQDSFRAAAWESLGKGSPHCPSAGPVLPRCCPGAAPVLPRCCPGAGPLLPRCCPRSPDLPGWCVAGSALWETVASALGARRVARRGRVMPDGMRTPRVTLLLGQHGWVEHMDNGIRWAGAAGCGCVRKGLPSPSGRALAGTPST